MDETKFNELMETFRENIKNKQACVIYYDGKKHAVLSATSELGKEYIAEVY